MTGSKEITHRLLFYWSRLFSLDLKKGEDYSNLRKTVLIVIANFELDNLKGIEKYLTKWQIREDTYVDRILTDYFEIDILELPKVEKYYKKQKNENLLLWTKFLQNSQCMTQTDLEENKNIEKAVNELGYLNKDEATRDLAFKREIADINRAWDLQYSHDEGKAEGIKEGEKTEKIKTAKKMLQKNIDIQLIMEITELPKEEIEKIKLE